MNVLQQKVILRNTDWKTFTIKLLCISILKRYRFLRKEKRRYIRPLKLKMVTNKLTLPLETTRGCATWLGSVWSLRVWSNHYFCRVSRVLLTFVFAIKMCFPSWLVRVTLSDYPHSSHEWRIDDEPVEIERFWLQSSVWNRAQQNGIGPEDIAGPVLGYTPELPNQRRKWLWIEEKIKMFPNDFLS